MKHRILRTGRQTCYTSSEVIGKSLYSVLQGHGALGTKVCACDFYTRHAAAEHCKIPNFDLEVTVRSGRRIWVDLSTLDFKNGRTHPPLVVHLSRDITQRKHNEDLLHKMLQLSKQIIAVSGNIRILPLKIWSILRQCGGSCVRRAESPVLVVKAAYKARSL